jgi:hypothetical protein
MAIGSRADVEPWGLEALYAWTTDGLAEAYAALLATASVLE